MLSCNISFVSKSSIGDRDSYQMISVASIPLPPLMYKYEITVRSCILKDDILSHAVRQVVVTVPKKVTLKLL